MLVNGKSIFTARQVQQVYVSPAENRLIVALTHFSKDSASAQGAFLLVDGKPAEATLTPALSFDRVLFSPDGKRYAAICGAAPNKFVVLDGKKGQEYFDVYSRPASTLAPGIAFSADSNTLAYEAATPDLKRFIVTTDESDALANCWFVFSPDGKRIAYGGVTGQGGQKYLLSLDGKPHAGRSGLDGEFVHLQSRRFPLRLRNRVGREPSHRARWQTDGTLRKIRLQSR